MTFSEMHNSYLDSLSGARDEEPPFDDEEEDEEDLPMHNIDCKRYVRMNTETDEMFEDILFLPEEAARFNEKLAADSSEFRWVPYGAKGEMVAA